MSETFTISGITLTVNVDIIDKKMIEGLKWWKASPDASLPLCPFVMVHKSCPDMCGKIFAHLNVYKECPFKSGVYIQSFLKELAEKIIDAWQKKENDKKMSRYS